MVHRHSVRLNYRARPCVIMNIRSRATYRLLWRCSAHTAAHSGFMYVNGADGGVFETDRMDADAVFPRLLDARSSAFSFDRSRYGGFRCVFMDRC